MKNQKIHFFHFDERACGNREYKRRVTVNPNKVTCEKCKENDRLVDGILNAEILEKIK